MHSAAEDSRASLPMTGAPLYQRLAEHYRHVIRTGTLAPGERMPSVRALMRQHHVSLSTALQTFRHLEDAGWLEARPRSGYFVRLAPTSRLPGASEPDMRVAPAAARYVGLHERISSVIERAHAAPDALNLGGATAAASLYPGAALQALAVKLLRHHPTLLTDTGGEGHCPAFRQALAHRAMSCGVVVAPQDIIVTNGAVEAMSLALRAVAQSGDTIAIESPAFFGLLQLLESLGLRALEIPTSPTTGISLEALDTALSAYGNVKAVVVVPHLQNPLGSVMPDARKAGLVTLCRRHGIAIVEDEPYRELLEHAEHVQPVKAWDRDGSVIYCVSLNKILAPGMRLGWMDAGRWSARVRMLKYAQTRHGDVLTQRVAAEFIGSGAYDRHLHRLRARLRVQRDATADAIARHFPAGTRLGVPPAGLLLWVELADGHSSEHLFHAALREGIRIAPGTIFSNSGRFDAFLRLSCAQPFDRDLDDALRRLGRLARHG
ncbi:PLP-dependent aminotransferase family protein [Robbsia sp. Bb-Pol-6]|uniref:PLP-dependent aminotransferase family protein n=1 Tax=Robbsia betulipollinis TaxID=2981849 RepID=A0ABT3ZUW7_9BURK|nr:PLP-dependent aminotransferase family protein [Robbsia betulipollinis]MCY0389690.1 PLP-dependent aminotransferase family protein [Robbsia betulipollinis]